jgi:glycosyltransferase involved in cell wall biosynthesis
MASGLSVIGADAGGVGEIIQQENTGLKFMARNSEELTKSMAKLMDDNDLRDYLKANAREFSLTRSWEKVFEELIDIYEAILAKRGISTVCA